MKLQSQREISSYKYLLYFCGFYIMSLVITASIFNRLVEWHGIVEPAGIFVFPLMYFFGDLISEVYGYTIARQMILVAFACDMFFSFTTAFLVNMPSPETFHYANAYNIVFDPLPRLFIISSISMSISEFINIKLISRWKELLNGRYFFMRSLGSSAIGEGVLSLISIPLIFYGKMSLFQSFKITLSIYVLKLVYTVIVSTIGAFLVTFLKIIEGVTINNKRNPLIIQSEPGA